MKKSSWILNAMLVLMLITTAASSTPASTEYVNTQIFKALADIQMQFTQEHKAIESKLSGMPAVTVHHLGEVFQGGVIFYVDSSAQHGLMVSLHDVGQPIQWRNGDSGDRIVNASAQGLGAGEMNTRLIIAQETSDEQDGEFAALMAANYQISADGLSPCPTPLTPHTLCYGGWYLPSLNELLLMVQALKQGQLSQLSQLSQLGQLSHLGQLGQLDDGIYWSSSEVDATQALGVEFNSGKIKVLAKSALASIRAIHAF